MKLLLLHPPLLSPVVWRRLVPLLEDAGHVVAAPDLRPRRTAGWWDDAADAALAAMPDAEVVLAHSGAGALVPVVLARITAPRAFVLLDAVLPAATGGTKPSPSLREAVRDMALDGVLPPWTSWWGDRELAELVPDDGDRADLAASAPRIPEAFYDAAVPTPDGWEPPLRAYLRLSPAYADHAAAAATRGWRVRSLPGRHLDPLARPAPVAAAVLDLLAGTRSGGRAERVVPDLLTRSREDAVAFYRHVVGLEPVMDHGWIVTLAAPGRPDVQLSLMTHDGTAPVVPDVSVQVDDVDAAHAAAVERGAEIVHPLTDEPWGVRRFFVRDPGGHVVNVLGHAPSSGRRVGH